MNSQNKIQIQLDQVKGLTDEEIGLINSEMEENINLIRKPLASAGGKYFMLSILKQCIPDHKTYLEPFAGGAALFWAKESSEKEILSDLNKDYIDFFQFLKEGSEDDFKWMRTQNFQASHERFNYIRDHYKTENLRERFYRTLYLTKFSFGSKEEHFGWGIKGDSKARNVLNDLEKFKDRLKNTELLHRNGLDVIKEFDSEVAFFFLDPPWKDLGKKGFQRNFTNEQLAGIIGTIKGKFLLVVEKGFEKEYLKNQNLKENPYHIKRVSVGAYIDRKNPGSKEYFLVSNFTWQLKANLNAERANLIKKSFGTYDPEQLDDQILVGDRQIVFSWLFSIDKGKKLKYKREAIIQLLSRIVQEELKRGKTTYYPNEMTELSKKIMTDEILPNIISSGLYLVPPHAKVISDSNSTAIVKTMAFDNMQRFNFLISGNLIYGLIRTGKPQEIDLKQFETQRDKHGISKDERLAWWPNKEKLYFYPIREFFNFSKPRKLKKSRDIQTFISPVNFSETNEDREMAHLVIEFDPTKLSLEQIKSMPGIELTMIHSELHRLYAEVKEEEPSNEPGEILNAHAMIIQGIKHRDMEHQVVDKMDEIYSVFQNKGNNFIWFEDILPYANQFIDVFKELDRTKKDITNLSIEMTIHDERDDVSGSTELNKITQFPKELLADFEKEMKQARGFSKEQVKGFRFNPEKLAENFWVLQNHYQGTSVHGDFWHKMNSHIKGKVLMIQVADSIPEINSLSQAWQITKSMFGPSPEKVFKFYPDMAPNRHVLSDKKPAHPLKWITIIDDEIKPGDPGATKLKSGFYTGADWGLLKQGAIKPGFEEYFLYGSNFKGKKIGYKRLVFKLLSGRPGQQGDKKGFHWEAFITHEDSPPYLLTQRQRKKADYVPAGNSSGLPAEFEKIVPDDIRWWDKNLGKDAKIKRINQFYNSLIEKKIITGKPVE